MICSCDECNGAASGEVLKCRECGLLCDATGQLVRITTSAQHLAVLALERRGGIGSGACCLCLEGEMRNAARLMAGNGRES